MVKYTLSLALTLFAFATNAADTPIEGNVQAKCIINTEVNGVYANPAPDKLSTKTSDGGVEPSIRFDVAIADFYLARIKTPISFSAKPNLIDVVNWTGATVVGEVSVSGMSAYNNAKVTYENTTEFRLTLAGSTWFKVDSIATYGGGRAFPGGTYRAVVQAECIAR